MKRFATLLLAAVAFCLSMQAQPARPKLVVGLVVDQMRWDYLYRYLARYGEGGFKRLLNEGYSFDNTRIPYIPSVTAIGHTTIYTGSVPSIHGIAGNDFVINDQKVYCTDDANVSPVGTDSKAGKMSPRKLWATTIGDEMKIATNGRSHVVGVALKDRASILPAGHAADGAYWFDDKTGNFITSSYYMKELPAWVKTFNKKRLAEKYLSEKWTTLYAVDTYKESTADLNNYEENLRPEVTATLPLDLPMLYKKYGNNIIRNTPFGASITFDMAKAAVEGEALGSHTDADFLTVSISSTDYIGHQVGTHAIETEDTYLRLDKDLASFLTFLDQKVGRGNYLLFLSADHGAMNNSTFLQDRHIPAGSWNTSSVKKQLNEALAKEFGGANDLVKYVMNYQVFFDHEAVKAKGLNFCDVKRCVVNELQKDTTVLYAVDFQQIASAPVPCEVKERAINGYNRERSGDVQVVLKPNFYAHGSRGTNHAAWYGYDTHIPLVFMGWGIQHGSTNKECFMTDIAATVCALLHVQAPNGCIGHPLF